ncbi:MAG: sugar ABC transporter permease [Ruminococcaceae bacterium]|nr:sugar ABC transporter permease [Oscillospiraceae bacterium]
MTNTVEVQKTKKRKKAASLEKKKARAGWVFVLPFVLGFIIVYFPIVFESIKSSLFFQYTKEGGGIELQFNYFKSYYLAFFHAETGDFTKTLFESVGDIILDIPMILLFSLFMAVLLNQKMVGRAAFRAIFFVPVILSTGIIEAIDASSILDTMDSTEGIDDGSGASAAGDIVNAVDMQRLFNGISVTDGMLKYVTDAINDIFNIVNRSGVQMLIFLAGLQSISPAIYESVQIDGASAWETFWKITFPMISPMILVNAVYTVIDAFTAESAVMTYISQIRYSIANEGQAIASAMSWIYFLLVIAILGVLIAVLSAYTFYQKKK